MTAKKWEARWTDNQMALTVYSQPDGDQQVLIIKSMSPKFLRTLYIFFTQQTIFCIDAKDKVFKNN